MIAKNKTAFLVLAFEVSLVLLVMASAVPAQGSPHVLQRLHNPPQATYQLSTRGGDVNGDGVGDLFLRRWQAGAGYSLEFFSGLSGATLLTTPPGLNAFAYGDLEFVGDVDGDGADDFAWIANTNNTCTPGQLHVHSGMNWAVILTIPQLSPWTSRFEGGGDVNGDSVPDLIVSTAGSQSQCMNPNPPFVDVYSGSSGALMHHFVDPFMNASNNPYGTIHDHLGDVNGDGFGDILVTDRGYSRVWVYSGLDGSVIHFIQGPSLSRLGYAAAAIGDVDGDMASDFVVGAPYMNVGGATLAGEARVYSGATGNLIRSHVGSISFEQLGDNVSAPGDMDGDGIGDYCVSARGSQSPNVLGYIEVRSGATGVVIFSIVAPVFGQLVYGYPVGDVNGDGFADLAVADGGLTIYSSVAATALVLEAPPALGSTVPLSVVSPADPGKTYVCGFSGGSIPGIPLSDGRTVPLNWDPLLLLSLDPTNPFFANTVGSLDVAGQATVTMSVPPLLTLDGVTLFGAFAVSDPTASLGIGTISHPHTITFHP